MGMLEGGCIRGCVGGGCWGVYQRVCWRVLIGRIRRARY